MHFAFFPGALTPFLGANPGLILHDVACFVQKLVVPCYFDGDPSNIGAMSFGTGSQLRRKYEEWSQSYRAVAETARLSHAARGGQGEGLEQGFNQRFRLLVGQSSRVLAHYVSLAVDDDGVRQDAHIVAQFLGDHNSSPVADQDRVVHPE